MTVAEFELAFKRCRNNLKTVGNLAVRKSLQDFDAIERYLHPKCRSVLFQKRRKLCYFHHFQVFTRCRFQTVPVRVQFSKFTVFKMCRQKMCRFQVNGRPIRHIFTVFKIYRFQNVSAKNVPFSSEREAYPSHFHRFQNVPASCERSLNLPDKSEKFGRL